MQGIKLLHIFTKSYQIGQITNGRVSSLFIYTPIILNRATVWVWAFEVSTKFIFSTFICTFFFAMVLFLLCVPYPLKKTYPNGVLSTRYSLGARTLWLFSFYLFYFYKLNELAFGFVFGLGQISVFSTYIQTAECDSWSRHNINPIIF